MIFPVTVSVPVRHYRSANGTASVVYYYNNNIIITPRVMPVSATGDFVEMFCDIVTLSVFCDTKCSIGYSRSGRRHLDEHPRLAVRERQLTP